MTNFILRSTSSPRHKFLFIFIFIKVEELEKETGVLGKERALQGILKKMLIVQEDKVAKLKELIEDHKEKEISTQDTVTKLEQLVEEGKQKIKDHLDALKNIADKVRGEEMEKINRFDKTYTSYAESQMNQMNLPISGELSEESSEIDFDSNKLNIGRPIKSANRIKSMKKIKSVKKIKSITVSFIEMSLQKLRSCVSLRLSLKLGLKKIGPGKLYSKRNVNHQINSMH